MLLTKEFKGANIVRPFLGQKNVGLRPKVFRSMRRATKGSAVGDYLWKLQAFEKA